jgi:hypothetical protein
MTWHSTISMVESDQVPYPWVLILQVKLLIIAIAQPLNDTPALSLAERGSWERRANALTAGIALADVVMRRPAFGVRFTSWEALIEAEPEAEESSFTPIVEMRLAIAKFVDVDNINHVCDGFWHGFGL